MREIKFRVWDKTADKFRDLMVYDVKNGKVVVRFPIETLKKGEYQLEQYTGLKDKNGKEIYEGDIAKFKNFNNKLMVGEIKYSTEDAMFRLEYTNNSGYQDWDYASRFNLEIIGNIHENPELLEDKNE